jgi:hypothetical protein
MPTVTRAGRGLARAFLGGALFLGGLSSAQAALPSVAKMLEYQPRQEARITTPGASEQAGCKVELVKEGAGSGYVLKDGAGKVLRRYFSSNGRSVDSWSYYKDGAEVYREVDTTGSGKPDQYRWLNAGGSKWGVDSNKDGTIDSWKVISPEEVSQEALRALATNDLGRLRALLITDEDVKALGLSAEQADAIKERRKGVKEKFEATVKKLTKLTEKAAWLHLETAAPQCVPAGTAGAKSDVIQHARGTVLFESGGSNEWFQTGQMLLVNQAWRLIDAPTPGAAVEDKGGDKGLDVAQDPKLQKLVEELTALDKKAIGTGSGAVKHHLARADLLEKIVGAVKASERDPWIRQVADSLASAVQAGTAKDTAAATRLASLEKQLRQVLEGSNLTAYVVFRRMQADYGQKLGAATEKTFDKVQKDWVESLTAFVKAYPKAEDAADAMLQLGMVSEFLGKDTEAKNWYAKLAKDFAGKPQAVKAAGAVRRLELEGKAMSLSGPKLDDPKATAGLDDLRGKLVVVYYWASWNGQAASDFTKLKALTTANKDVAVLTVNLDTTPEEAKAFVAKHSPVGTHLHQKGGLDGKLATDYGVMVLPGAFVVGKDGKCLNRAAQVGALEDEVKKHLKK